MNKKITVIILVSVFILISLIVSISLFNSRPQTDSANDQSILPTTSPVNRRYGTIYNKSSTVLNNARQNVISDFKGFLPYDSENLAVNYSPISDLIYIEIKNEKADEELQKFLEQHSLVSRYTNNPGLFIKTTTNISELINENEQALTEDFFEIPESTPFPTTTPNPNDPSRDVEPMINVFKSLMGFNITLLPYSPTTKIPAQPTSNSQTAQADQTTPITGTVTGSQIGAYKMRVKWDFQNLELTCKPKPGTLAIVAYLKKQFGSSASYGIPASCKTYTGKVYAHLAGLGVDYYFLAKEPAALKRGNEVFAWLVTNAQNIGIQYVKFWRVHWTPSGGLHCVDNTITPHDQKAHSNHIHFELNLAGANKQTPFFTRGAALPAAMVINQEICPQLDMDFRQ